MKIKRKDWKYRGLPGHFCGASECAFRLCTKVGDYLISTVGAYYPSGFSFKPMEQIGFGRHYETYVFHCPGEEPDKMNEIDSDSIKKEPNDDPYSLDKRAEKMHDDMCVKYSMIK